MNFWRGCQDAPPGIPERMALEKDKAAF